MRVDIDSQLFQCFKKNSNTTQLILGLQSRDNPLVRLQSSSLSPSLTPCLSSGNHSQRLFQKTIERFDCKIKRRAQMGKHKHRAFPTLLQSLRAATACLRKTCHYSCDTDSVQESTRFWCFVNFGRLRVTFCFHAKWNFRWNWREVVAN